MKLLRYCSHVSLLWLLMGFVFSLPTAAQDRPLQTPDAETVPAGTVRAQVGFDFLQEANYPLTGLTGDLTSLGVMDLRLGVGSIVEVELQGTVHEFLDIKHQGASFVTLHLTGTNSTGDSGNYSLWTKVRILGEGERHPAVAFRFGYQMPNEKQISGLGTNTSNVFASVILQKHFFGRLNLFGDAGIGILQVPLTTFQQNDVLTYGGAFVYKLNRRVNLVGEVAGRYSTRPITTALIGTESHSQARLGFQIFAGGFRWDLAGIAGLNKADPQSGFTFGVSRDIHLFNIPSDSK
jgi:hypothetical protein